MNISRLVLTALLTIGLLTLAPTGQAAKLSAADKAAQKASKQASGFKRATLKDLDLTAEQKQKLKEIQDQQREKTQALHNEFEKKLEGILTPDQLTKFKELNARKAGAAAVQPNQTTPPPKRKKNNPSAAAK